MSSSASKPPKVTQSFKAKMTRVTQAFRGLILSKKRELLRYLLQLSAVAFLLYTPGILNANIEQECQAMPRDRTSQEKEFLSYFRSIEKEAIKDVLAQKRSTGPLGYSTSLVMARILKVKERISSDRELSEKLAKIHIYREAIGISRHEIPAHNTFHTLRHRLGPEGFAQIHQRFVLQAHQTGLLTPPIPDLPQMVKDKIILIGDSTFLKAVASSKGEKDAEGNWLFTDESIAFGKPHHKHKYPVGHRAHTLTAVSGIPIVSLLAPAN